MEVLNKKQRRNAYWFFILFFILTISVLLISIFFNIYFPFKENSLLKRENVRMKREMEIQNRISFQLEKAKAAIDSIGAPKQNDFFNEKLASSILVDIYKQIPEDTLKNKNMYNNTIIAYKDLIDAKKQIKQLTEQQSAMDSLNTINKKLKEEYDKIKIDLSVCRQLYQAQ
ncbi:type VI secretion system TssO [Elizabethkingia miricola]|uniref:type VI secretion system TssO n=1 Tax=Elizabethkingia miricola TaxID=172045 RepID=UPI002ACD95F1|nr:type VI secretion system TssO [Elizabethkingia miricola]WQM39431.1 type VI secretion system TssO [Elizabethkingia miricola]